MISFIERFIFAGAHKNSNAPYIFLAKLTFILGSTFYYALQFDAHYIVVRSVLHIAILVAFVLLERSALKTETLAYLSPIVMITLLHVAILYVRGDFLMFTFAFAGALFSLSYMNPRGLGIYIGVTAVQHGLLIIIPTINVMGARFETGHLYVSFAITLGMNITLYIFCKSYTLAQQAKEVFMSNMSHEIRTPITAVLGISEIGLRDANMPAEAKKYFTRIFNSSELLLGLVNDLLDFSKMENDQVTLVVRPYDVAEMIGHVYQPGFAYLKGSEIAFDLLVDAQVPCRLEGDALRIEQILINVLSNAFKYTEEGAVTLSVAARPDKDGQVIMQFTIRDTGLGMTEAQVNSIYNAYARFHEHSKTNVYGTGLGMSIVSNLLKAMNGTVDIQSTVGEGTTVTIRIAQKIADPTPLCEETIRRLRQFEASTDEQKLHPPATAMTNGRVLVVDDIEENLFVIEGLLRFYALQIETCQSGEEAITKIKQGQTYDLIFLDQMMPNLNGTQTMRHLRELGYHRPIIILTANALAGMEEKYLKKGFDGYLSKPIVTKNLHDTLLKYIPTMPPEAAPAEPSPGTINKIRTNFARNKRHMATEIKTALQEGDMASAHLLAHTLKGLAATIHEHTLAQAAEAVELLLDQGTMPSEGALLRLENALRVAVEGIAGEVNALPVAASAGVVASASAGRYGALLAVLHKLKPLLEGRDTACLELAAALEAFPEAVIIVAQMKKLQFAAAAKSLDALLGVVEE